METKTSILTKSKSWCTKTLLVFIMTVISLQGLYADDFEVDGVCYRINHDAESVTVISLSTLSNNATNTDNNKENQGEGGVEPLLLGIPEKVTYDSKTYRVSSIGDKAFQGYSTLKSIEIPNSIKNIGQYAFVDCSSLTSVVIPDSVTSIGSFAFAGCCSITSMVVSAGNIVYDSREDCNAIIETKTNTLIAGCKTSVIPKSVTVIGEDAFFGCSELESVIIPSNITSIGMRAFAGCSSLASIVVEDGNSVYDSHDNCNAIIETKTNSLIAGCKNTVFPKDLLSISFCAFYGCSSLASVEIPDGVTEINGYAFGECSGLKRVMIPGSVTSVNSKAFENCTSLDSFICLAYKVPSIIGNRFGLLDKKIVDVNVFSLSNEAKLYVPSMYVKNYKAATGWKTFYKILPVESIDSSFNSKEFKMQVKNADEQEKDKRKEAQEKEDNENPIFKGGRTALDKFISSNLKYPSDAWRRGVQGRVLVQFVVDVDGSVIEPTVFRSLDKDLDAEALRVVKLTNGKWIPGKKDGINVKTKYTLPVIFRIMSKE